jgi:hypothetical protein
MKLQKSHKGMSNMNIGRKDVIWNYVATLPKIGAGVIPRFRLFCEGSLQKQWQYELSLLPPTAVMKIKPSRAIRYNLSIH